MGTLSANFSKHEFECKCCGLYVSNFELVQTLQTIRNVMGCEVIVNSGTRCKKHNAELPNSVPNSAHLTGEAADIYCHNVPQQRLGDKIKYLQEHGQLPFLRYCSLIKGSKTAVHVGVDNKQRSGIFNF